MEYSPTKMKTLLENYGFNFKKNFGQNFIIDENVINSIVDKSEIDKETLVIEIGPGAGSLTYGLATKAKNVLCYEIDTTLKDILDSNLSDFSNVDVIYEDFLKVDVNNPNVTVWVEVREQVYIYLVILSNSALVYIFLVYNHLKQETKLSIY